MENKIIEVAHVSYERKDTIKTYVLPSASIFVQSWNYREVIGIYPVPYDYGQRGPEGAPVTGFIYNVRIGIREAGEPTQIISMEVPDWSFREFREVESKTPSTRDKWVRRVFDIVCRDTEYNSKISEHNFESYFTAMVSEAALPNVRIQFVNEPK